MGHDITYIFSYIAVLLAIVLICQRLNEDMYKAEYMSADEFYKTFKIFKENLKEKGPDLVTQVLKSHEFAGTKIKVSFLKTV